MRVEGVDVAVLRERRVDGDAEQAALVVGGDARQLQERRGETWLAPGWTTQIVPSRSAISMRPSGVNVIAVGSSIPMITRSLANCGAVLGTVTVTAGDVVRLPAASRAIAVSVCAPGRRAARVPRDAVGRRRVLGAEARPVELELHSGDAQVVGASAATGTVPLTDAPAARGA